MDDETCAVCLEVPELTYELPCKHRFCYLCIKPAIITRPTCPLCRGHIPPCIIEHATMKEEFIRMKEQENRWYYSGRNNGWWKYVDSHNETIEEAYEKFLSDPSKDALKIEIMGVDYTINFSDMIQISPAGAVRKIKRGDETEISKGVAGIQIEKVKSYDSNSSWGSPSDFCYSDDDSM